MNKYIYPLIDNPFSDVDIYKGIKVLKSKQLTISKKTTDFEKDFTLSLKSKHSLMVNSGSSANLLALQCLINPYRKNRLKKGDEVIIPTLCWSTSLWPIIQSNLKPVFVDINPLTLNIDEQEIEKKINKKTKAILLVHVLGNSCDMDQIMKIKNKYNLILIEDGFAIFFPIIEVKTISAIGFHDVSLQVLPRDKHTLDSFGKSGLFFAYLKK